MKIPSVNLSVDYVNALITGSLQTKFVNVWNVQKEKKGMIEFIIYRHRFPTLDTLGELLKRLTKTLGCEPHIGYSTGNTQGYYWQFTSTRAVYIEHRKGVGAFIQLTDTGN